jgi:hypothetical protein
MGIKKNIVVDIKAQAAYPPEMLIDTCHTTEWHNSEYHDLPGFRLLFHEHLGRARFVASVIVGNHSFKLSCFHAVTCLFNGSLK